MPRRKKPIAMTTGHMSKSDRLKRIKTEKFLGGNANLSKNKVPKGLNKRSRNVYKFLVNSFPSGTLHPVDAILLKQIALLNTRIDKLNKFIKKNGLMMKRANGNWCENPALKAYKASLAQEHKLLCEICATPSTRAKLATTDDIQKVVDNADPLNKILHPSKELIHKLDN